MTTSNRTITTRWTVCGTLLCMACLLLRDRLEQVMFLHMLLQIPLLLLSGYCFSCGLSTAANPAWIACRSGLRRFNAFGMTGLFALLFISAYWMIPRALEECLTAPWAEAGKFASLIVLGMILPSSIRRANWIAQLFFLGYFCSMMAIVGMMYQDSPQRLCNAYLINDQVYTGTGLVAASILIPLWWCIWQATAKTRGTLRHQSLKLQQD